MPPAAMNCGALPRIKAPPANDKPDMSSSGNNQIHTYHKLFWRINMTVEFNIFYHKERNLYEIAAYNSEKDQEFIPLFLIEEQIKLMSLGQNAINAEIEKIKLKLSKDRFNKIPGPAEMVSLATSSLFNSFIESHLNPKADGTLSLANLPGEDFDFMAAVFTPPQLEQEEEDEEEIFEKKEEVGDEKPIGLPAVTVGKEVVTKTKTTKPSSRILKKSPSCPNPVTSETVTVVRRHRSSIQEFNNTLSILKKDSTSLKNANRMTENLLNLSVVSVDAFKNALQQKAGTSKFYDKSTPLGLFRWAVHRIVLQQYIEAVKLRIDKLNSDSKQPRAIRINGSFPAPGSTDMRGPQAKVYI